MSDTHFCDTFPYGSVIAKISLPCTVDACLYPYPCYAIFKFTEPFIESIRGEDLAHKNPVYVW